MFPNYLRCYEKVSKQIAIEYPWHSYQQNGLAKKDAQPW